MDALALLCTLHADGPSTLARLRAADCTTIERVASEAPERLAELMRTSANSAARFQREAHNLILRLGSESSTIAPIAVHERAPPKPNPLERVLSTWRERDEAEAVVAIDEFRPAMPRVISATVPTAITVGAVDGIDAETSATFARAGLRDLPALAACDALEFARRTGLSYSRVMRLRALARRASVQASPPLQSSPPKLSPAEAPTELGEPLVRFERDYVLQPIAPEEGAGGPFA